MQANISDAKITNICLKTDMVNDFVKTKDYSMANEAEFDVKYSTGYLPFDYTACGNIVHVLFPNGTKAQYDSAGIVDGSLLMLIGRSGCGKSTFGVQVGANIVRNFNQGMLCIDITEATGIMKDRVKELTGFNDEEFNNKVIMRNAGITIENVYRRIKMIHDKKISNPDKFKYNTGLVDCFGQPILKFQPTVYLVDSIPFLTSEKYADEEEMSGQMSTTANAKALAQFYRRLTQPCKEANIIVIFINHILMKIESGITHTKGSTQFLKQGESLPGGLSCQYACTIIRLDDGTKLTPDKEFGVYGCVVNVSNTKSRAGMSGAISGVDLVLNYAVGFDPDLSLFLMLKNAGRVNGAGAYLYFGDRSDYKFSQKNFKEKLVENPELCQIFANEVMTHLRFTLDELEKMKTMSSQSSNVTSLILSQLMNPAMEINNESSIS